MKRIALTFVLSTVALTACSKYGPDQEQSPEASAAPAAAVPGSPTIQSDALKEDVAVAFDMPQASYSLRCDLNSVGGVGLAPGVAGPLASAPGIVFNGWVSDEKGVPPAKAVIVLKGAKSFGILATTGADRPDVAEALKAESARKSGLAVLADTTLVAPGAYHVHLYVPENRAACDTTKLLNVGG